MSAQGLHHAARERSAHADDTYAYYGANAALATKTMTSTIGSAAQRTGMSNAPIVNNYYVQDERSVPLPLFLTPNISLEDITLSQTQRSQPQPASSLTPRPRLKRERELTHHGRHLVNAATAQLSNGRHGRSKSSSYRGDVVNPYDKCYQGHVHPITEEEERTFVNESMDYYRRMKLPRKDPLVLSGEGDGVPHESSNMILSGLRNMQEQYDHLNRVVEETRKELQRSREESERARSDSHRFVTDLRVEMAQLTKHVELLEDRHSSLEQSVSSIRGMQSLVDSIRGDLVSLRTEVGQKSNAIAVLEKSVESIKSHLFSPSVAVTSGVPAASAPLSFSSPAAPAIAESATVGLTNPCCFGKNSVGSSSSSSALKPVDVSTTGVSGASVPAFSFNSVPTTSTGEVKAATQGFSFTPSAAGAPTGSHATEGATDATATTNPFSMTKPSPAFGASSSATPSNAVPSFGTASAMPNPFSAPSVNAATNGVFGGAPMQGVPAASSTVSPFAQPLESTPSFSAPKEGRSFLGSHTRKKATLRY